MTDYDVLESMGREIQAEHTLIAHRLNWNFTSQSFLFTAYAIAGGDNDWRGFFQVVMPFLGIVLSGLALMAVCAALWVQDDLIGDQTRLIEKMRGRFVAANDTESADRLDDYAKTTCHGRRSGDRFHKLAMTPPFLVPVVFILA